MRSDTDLVVDERPLSREAFEQALREAVDAWAPEETRFYQLVMSGRCPRPVMLRYARSTYRSANLFCATVAEMVDKAPDEQARLILLENLLEEEGIHLRPDRGLIVRSQRRHPALALRFLRACGGNDDDDVANAPHATAVGRRMLAEGRWLEAVSHMLVGQELKFGTASGLMFEGLLKCGFAERDLAFFAIHVEKDRAHGRQALDLVLDRARTAEEQRQCIAAAGDGARIWFDMHGSSTSARRAA